MKITSRSIQELKLMYKDILVTRDILNGKENEILEELLRRHSLTEQFKSAGKEGGSQSFEVDGIKLKFEISKKVTWDSEWLMKVASTLPPEIAKKIFEIKFSVPSKTFDALTDADLIKALRPARTVQYGQPTVTFVKD